MVRLCRSASRTRKKIIFAWFFVIYSNFAHVRPRDNDKSIYFSYTIQSQMLKNTMISVEHTMHKHKEASSRAEKLLQPTATLKMSQKLSHNLINTFDSSCCFPNWQSYANNGQTLSKTIFIVCSINFSAPIMDYDQTQTQTKTFCISNNGKLVLMKFWWVKRARKWDRDRVRMAHKEKQKTMLMYANDMQRSF